jgi:hypothetical protein
MREDMGKGLQVLDSRHESGRRSVGPGAKIGEFCVFVLVVKMSAAT